MLLRLFRVPANRRLGRALLVSSIVASTLGAAVAHADSAGTASPTLSTRVEGTSSGTTVSTVRTRALRAAAPAGAPRILIIGTGVQRALFPAGLQPSIAPAGGPDVVDGHGYGTAAAAAILQLLPDAQITSIKVPAYDASYHLLKMGALADALERARAERDRYDIVLLAYPPQAALDPIAHLLGHADYGRFGTGMNLVVEALLSSRARAGDVLAGIPSEKGLRDRVFAGANLKQRDAVERYATQARAWSRVTDAVAALDDAGLAVVSPAGDFARTNGDAVPPAPAQTVFGLAALPSVITVGASYADGSVERVSPTSGRGPTLSLDLKPDLLAPSDVLTMIPEGSQLGWKDDSMRLPLQMLDWAKPGTTPSPCPSLQGIYRCTLQGTSIVSAALVAANLGASVASGMPHTAATRRGSDDEVLRGLAWARASATDARAADGNRVAWPWEQGAGVFGGLRGLDVAATPVALGRADLGETGWNAAASKTVPLWAGGATAGAAATITSFIGPDQSGASIAAPYPDTRRIAATADATGTTLTAAAGRYQGGVYAGYLTFASAGGAPVRVPLSLTQGVPLDFSVSYAYTPLQTGGPDGERVEDATMVLFAGLPTNVGLIGDAFKNLSGKAFKNAGGDPTNNIIIRYATTRNSFDDPSIPAAQHGTGRIASVPPGFYRMHVLTDNGIDAVQARGREESLGVRLGSFGPDAAYVPGSNVLVGAQPPCDGPSPAGPLSPGCTTESGRSVDPSTGFCEASNSSAQVAFNVYCAPIAYALPSAVVTRAVHMIQHDALPTKSEWTTCGVDIPLNGTGIDVGALVKQASNCPSAKTIPTGWTFPAGAPDCLSGDERAAFPGGHPDDLRAVYKGAGAGDLPGRNFPVAVMSYRFALPSPNTYTTAGMSLAYVADNAIVGVRFQTGDDAGDASNSLLVADDPDVRVTPALERAPAKGSEFDEWAVMSANAAYGTLSIIVIPTVWARPDLSPTDPIAQVSLCDVALRVATFAKQSWGRATVENGRPVQRFGVDPRGLGAQIDPTVQRLRPVLGDDGAFHAAGTEHESLTVAVQIPKNTTTDAAAPHHVRSPIGAGAYATGARASSGELLPAGFTTYDPGYGTQRLGCSTDLPLSDTDLDRRRNAETCRAYHAARDANQIVAELAPDAVLNGRFAGILSLSDATIDAAAGPIAFSIVDGDDHGAFDATGHWARSGDRYTPRIPVSTFFDDVGDHTIEPLAGVIRIVRDAANQPMLRIETNEIGGLAHTITSVLA